MDQILTTIGDTIAQFFGSPVVQLALQAAFVYLVILWLASAYWAFRDMQQRSDNVLLPYLAAAGIILFTPIFFIFAVWVYKIIRPHDKIGEVYERNLAEEALLNEVESIHHCPGCEHRIDDEWIICPFCRTRLNRVCPNCSRLVGMDWSLCAWCGKDFARRQVPAAAVEALPGTREATGRITSQAHIPAGGSGAAATSNPSVVRPSVMPTSGTLPASGGDPLTDR
jgi:RNA polymerase subunit RPABC4/transcription elongation factor Spt4